jgi:2-methylisocitrate lyase-like PEP mutase family enzyme
MMAACAFDYSFDELSAFADAGADVLEASVIPAEYYGSPFTLRDLIRYQRICRAVSLPVVVPTQLRVLPEDLPFLRDAGVKGIMIGAVVTGKEQEGILRTIEKFRSAIERL